MYVILPYLSLPHYILLRGTVISLELPYQGIHNTQCDTRTLRICLADIIYASEYEDLHTLL